MRTYPPSEIYRTGLTRRGQPQQMWKEKGAAVYQAAAWVGLKQRQSLGGHWQLMLQFTNLGLPMLRNLKV